MIYDDKFYSNLSVNGVFSVKENGIYSIRVKSSLGEWVHYPVDIQVVVSGITPLEAKTTVTNDIPQTTVAKDNQNIEVGRVVLSKPKNKKGKKVKITWKKIRGSNGYQIQYARNKKFTKSLKKTTAKASATTKIIKKLKKKKTYYFRVRAYKKTSSGKVYGAWSTVKKVKIKK